MSHRRYENSSQVLPVQWKHETPTLAAGASDLTFPECVRLGHEERCFQDAKPHQLHSRIELEPVNGVAVVNQEPIRFLSYDDLAELLQPPFRLGMSSKVRMSRQVGLQRGEIFGFMDFECRRIRSRRGRQMALYMPGGKKQTALLRKLKLVLPEQSLSARYGVDRAYQSPYASLGELLCRRPLPLETGFGIFSVPDPDPNTSQREAKLALVVAQGSLPVRKHTANLRTRRENAAEAIGTQIPLGRSDRLQPPPLPLGFASPSHRRCVRGRILAGSRPTAQRRHPGPAGRPPVLQSHR